MGSKSPMLAMMSSTGAPAADAPARKGRPRESGPDLPSTRRCVAAIGRRRLPGAAISEGTVDVDGPPWRSVAGFTVRRSNDDIRPDRGPVRDHIV
jgi:hypothetical protein